MVTVMLIQLSIKNYSSRVLAFKSSGGEPLNSGVAVMR